MKVHITKVDVFQGQKDPSKRWLKISYVQPNGTAGSAILPAPEKTPEVDIEFDDSINAHDLEIEPGQDGRTFRVVGISEA